MPKPKEEEKGGDWACRGASSCSSFVRSVTSLLPKMRVFLLLLLHAGTSRFYNVTSLTHKSRHEGDTSRERG